MNNTNSKLRSQMENLMLNRHYLSGPFLSELPHKLNRQLDYKIRDAIGNESWVILNNRIDNLLVYRITEDIKDMNGQS